MLAEEPTRRYDGLVARDSVFHLPRAAHGGLFRKTAPMFGVDFFYSGHAPEESMALLREMGFDIVRAKIDAPSSRGHLAILCKKIDRS